MARYRCVSSRTHIHCLLSCLPKYLGIEGPLTSIFNSFWIGFLSRTNQSHLVGNRKLVSSHKSVTASRGSWFQKIPTFMSRRSPSPQLNSNPAACETKENLSHVENSGINKQLCRPFRWGPTTEPALHQQSNSL